MLLNTIIMTWNNLYLSYNMYAAVTSRTYNMAVVTKVSWVFSSYLPLSFGMARSVNVLDSINDNFMFITTIIATKTCIW